MANPRSPSGPRTPVPRELAVQRIAAAADAQGFVPFDRFMEVALYDPRVGFYSRARSPFGPSGDYYTASHVHPLFGRTLAERLRTVRHALGRERPFRVAEVGPGDGSLAEVVLSALGSGSDGVAGIEYLLVERSAPLGDTALTRAGAAGESAGIPVRLAESLAADGPFEGAVIANETLDAQPARRLRWTGEVWRELGVRVEDTRLVEASAPIRTPVPPPDLPRPKEPGVIVEVSAVAEGAVREVSDHLARGLAVFLDYGMEESELLGGHPSGTLATVRGHRSLDDPLSDPGSADLSTFVNFTRIRAAAKRAGLEELAYRSQAEALGAWGFPALFDREVRAAPSPEAEVRLRLAAKNLLFGFDRFRVLELAAPNGAASLRALT